MTGSPEELMLRKVIIPSKENPTISIPTEFYGKKVEVLVIPFNNMKENQNDNTIDDIFDKYLYSFGKFKFNRDEANNYE